jgi:PAS domain S-box-containing protein
LQLRTESSTPDARIAALEGEVARLRAQLAQVVGGADDQMIWSTRPDGHHDYFNKRWYDYTGVPAGSTDGEGWNGMFHPDDQERAWTIWRRSLESGEPYEIEYRLRHHEDGYRWVLGRAHPVRAADGTILRWYGTCTDIHDLKAAEGKQRASEERLQRALDAGEIGDYEWDLRTGEIRWSDNLMKIVGLSPDTKVDGGTVWNLIHPEDRAMTQAVVERAIATGEQLEASYRVIGMDGVTRWIASRGRVVLDESGAPARLVGVNFDMSATRAAEDRLRETESRLQALTDNLPGVVVYQVLTSRDMSERQYVHVAGSARRVLGISPEDAMRDPKVMMDRIDPAQLPDVLAAERDASARLETLDIEIRGRLPRGDIRTRIISRPRELPDGRLLWDGMVIDITDRKRAQEEAQRTTALLHAIGDATPDLMFAKDLDLRLLYANAATCRTIGIPAERVVGTSNAELAVNADEGATLDANDRLVIESGETQVLEEAYTSPDGTHRIFRTVKTPMRDGSGRVVGLVGIGTDITDRVRAEELLRQSEARLRFLGEFDETLRESRDAPAAMTAAATVLALRLNVSRCAYASVEGDNDRFTIHQDYVAPGVASSAGTYSLDLFGPRAADDMRQGRTLVIHDVAHELPSGEGRETFQAIGVEAIVCCPLTKDRRLVAMMAVHQDRPRHWLPEEVELVEAAVERCWAHVERIGAEARLRESEERFRTLADNMPALCWWADATGYIYWYNRRWYDYTGTKPEDMEGWGWQSVHDPEVLPLVMERWTASIETGEPFEMTFPLRRADGEFRPFLTRIVPLRDEAGQVVRWFGTNTDIAEVKELEAALRDLNETLEQRVAEEIERRAQAEEALRQAQKMETLGQLTGGVAHDFNNLLQIVSGNIDLIQRNLPEENAKLRRAADNAARGAERAAVLTQRLLAFSRRQPLAPKPIDANRLVAGMSELLHRTLGETVEVETVLGSGLWTVEADAHQLENAILNLAINGRDAMPGGGKLTIETCNTHLDRSYVLANAEVTPGQYVCICVTDNGVGMDADTVARAFEPFFTTKEVGKGTGLGLSMVYGFVKQSGGHLKIYSEPGEGTTVKIYLPRLIGAQAEVEKKNDELVPEGAQHETILVCEDDEDVRAYTLEVLRELGYRVLEAEDGPSALRVLERRDERVDLLFTDVVLPGGMTGAVLADRARKLRPDLKVLFTTGYARNAIVHHGRLDPGVELITKPFSYSDLAARVRDMLDGTD